MGGVPRRERAILVSILLVGFSLRVWGVWNEGDYGLEMAEMTEALRICSGQPNLHRWAKRVFCYVLAVEYAGYYGFLRLTGARQDPMDFAKHVATDPEPLLLISRLTNVLLSTLTIWVAYHIGKLGVAAAGGLWAALLMSICPTAVIYAHRGSVDSLLVLVVLAAVFFSLRILYKGPSAWSYLLAGFFLALSFWAKTQGLLVAPCLLVAHVCAERRRAQSWRRIALSRLLLAAFGGFLLGLVLGNPVVLLAPGNWISHMFLQGKVFSGSTISANSPENAIMPFYFLKAAMGELGIPICVLALITAALGFWRRQMSSVIVALGAAMFFVVMGFAKAWFLHSQHQALYLLALLCILAGQGMGLGMSLELGKWKTVWQIGLVLCVLHFPIFRTAKEVLAFSGASTRVQAEEWIKANIPPGSRILMDSGARVNTFAPRIPESRASIQRSMDRVNEEIAALGRNVDIGGGKWDRSSLLYYRLRLQTAPEQAYDITSTELGRHLQPLEHYWQAGIQYVVTCSLIRDFITGQAREQFPISAEFYDALDSPQSPAICLATFGPSLFHRGAVYSIYAQEATNRREVE